MAAIKDHDRLDVLGEHIVDKLHTIIHISVTNKDHLGLVVRKPVFMDGSNQSAKLH